MSAAFGKLTSQVYQAPACRARSVADMGDFIGDVDAAYFDGHPDERALLRAFTHSFDITWARRQAAFGSHLATYFVKPAAYMERSFGFESEILTVYSPYDTLQPRTIQAIERFMSEPPARGRVDPMIAFIVSEASDAVQWTKQYTTQHRDSPVLAAFEASQLRAARDDTWLIRSLLADQLYQRDLFDYRLPIAHDSFFFGREDLVFDLSMAASRSENRGLFGLRKTGKTSAFFRLRRLLEARDDIVFVYIDCKFPGYRQLRWERVLERTSGEILRAVGSASQAGELHASDAFLAAVERLHAHDMKAVLIFDEIEYMSPFSTTDPHWREDFVPLWQTIWHAQSQFGNVAVFLGGVNPAVVEQDLVGDSQNPLFGLVPHDYVGGMTEQEIRRLGRTLGRAMGIRFTDDAISYVLRQYGGHPLLTRLAFSVTHKMLREAGAQLPIDVDHNALIRTEGQREAELSFYSQHVVSELSKFYPDEYELLTEIARGNLADVYEFTSDLSYSSHLKDYGLLTTDESGRPSISISAVGRVLQLSASAEKGRRPVLDIRRESERSMWLAMRKQAINDNIEQLQQEIARQQRPPLFGPNSYPESHRFFEIGVVTDESSFATFINTCNRCFVESIESYGRDSGNRQYFRNDIQRAYPALSEALQRIKVYRHHRVHLKLEHQTDEDLRRFLDLDLNGQSPPNVPDLWFTLQQRVLDDLLVGILVETDQLT